MPKKKIKAVRKTAEERLWDWMLNSEGKDSLKIHNLKGTPRTPKQVFHYIMRNFVPKK